MPWEVLQWRSQSDPVLFCETQFGKCWIATTSRSLKKLQNWTTCFMAQKYTSSQNFPHLTYRCFQPPPFSHSSLSKNEWAEKLGTVKVLAKVGNEVFSHLDVVLLCKVHLPPFLIPSLFPELPLLPPFLDRAPISNILLSPTSWLSSKEALLISSPLRKIAKLLAFLIRGSVIPSLVTHKCVRALSEASLPQKPGRDVLSQVSSSYWRGLCSLKAWNGKILQTTTFLYHIKLLI